MYDKQRNYELDRLLENVELQSNKSVFCPARQRLECVQEIRKLVEGAVIQISERSQEKKPPPGLERAMEMDS